MKVYQETRDRLNAATVLLIRKEVSRTQKLILWAHHSHVNHNSLGLNRSSMGQYLLASLGDQLYTIGFFTATGRAIFIRDSLFPPTVCSLVSTDELDIEHWLQQVATGPYFFDLTSLRNGHERSPWTTPLMSRLENRSSLRVSLARDFHAAVFIPEVHPPPMFLPALLRSLPLTWGLALDHWLTIAAVVSMRFKPIRRLLRRDAARGRIS
jgi:erythromycin esterase-like protein